MSYDEAFAEFKKLNFNLDTFCPHPFVSFYPSPRGDVFPCCIAMKYKAPSKVRKDNDVTKMMNTEDFKDLRRALINGERHAICNDCWIREDAGVDSDRRTVLQRFTHKKYIHRLQDVVDKTQPDGTIPDFKIKYLEFRDNNICNYRCRFCNINSSSTWLSEWVEMGRLKVAPETLNTKTGVAESGIDWNQIDLSELTDIHMAGGEPTAMDSTYWLLKRLVENGQSKNIEIGIVSNTSKLERKKQDILELLSNFKWVNWSTSIDGLGKVHDYLRSGGLDDFDLVDKNIWKIHEFVQQDPEKRSMKFHSTINWSNAFAWWDVWKRYQLEPDVPLNVQTFFSTGPEGTGINDLPNEYIQRIIDFYKPKSNSKQIGKIITFCEKNMAKTPEEDEKRWHSLMNYKEEQMFLDNTRDQVWLDVFPEWEDLWLEIPIHEKAPENVLARVKAQKERYPEKY